MVVKDKKTKRLKSWETAPFAYKMVEEPEDDFNQKSQKAINQIYNKISMMDFLNSITSPIAFFNDSYLGHINSLGIKSEYYTPRPVPLDLGAIKKCYCEWCGETETRLLYTLSTESVENEQNNIQMCPICAHSLDKITDEELERDLLICPPSKPNSTSKSATQNSSPVSTSEKT